MNEDTFHLGIKALIKNDNGKILLLKVNKKKLKGCQGKAYWDIPGGRIERKDTVEKTLKRELQEETGISNIQSFKHLNTVLSNIRIPTENGDVGLLLAVYLCEVGTSFGIELSDEHTEAKWFSPSEATNLLKIKYPQEFVEVVKTL